MKKWFKNAKGLTLVELLAVIVILGIIAAIAVPAISGSIKNSKKGADRSSYDLIVDAATRYSLDLQSTGATGDVAKANGNIATALVTGGYLSWKSGSSATAQSKSDIVFSDFAVAVSGGTITVTVYDDDHTTEITKTTFN